MEKSDSTWQVSIICAWMGDPTLIALDEREKRMSIGHVNALKVNQNLMFVKTEYDFVSTIDGARLIDTITS